MKRYANPRGTLIFMLIAIPIMVFIDMVLFDGQRPFVDYSSYTSPEIMPSEVSDYISAESDRSYPEVVYLPQPDSIKNENTKTETEKPKPKKEFAGLEIPPLKRAPGSEARVVIIIDDMGMGKSTAKLIPLPGPLTLSYLPYARDLSKQTKLAYKSGHELMLHMPMQPSKSDLDPGPDVLTTSMAEKELKDSLNKALESFDGYVGINNHMGSKLTSNARAMKWVMEVLRERKLFFIDSKTIGSSVGAQIAASYHLPFAERDVFLDHYTDIDSVRAALGKLERIARHQGIGIAIGHPKPDTIKALKEWLPTLEEKGIKLVPASAVVRKLDAVSLTDSSGIAPPDRLPSRRLE